MSKPLLFTPFKMRGVTAPNRCVVSPMVQYRATDGQVNDYHLVHLGKFALGKFGIVFTENCAIEPRGRVTQGDLGMWDDSQIEGHKRLVRFLKQEGALAATQITHSGRKGCTPRSFDKPDELGPEGAGWQRWQVVGPSALSAGERYADAPAARHATRSTTLVQKFGEAARRADAAGYDIIEIHGAHGYLLAQFLSPISNTRNDQYGGDRAGRMRFPLAAARAVREDWPEHKPMFIRVSAVDGAGGWDVDDTVAYAKELKALGIDVIDTSSGGLTGLSTALPVKRALGFQVPFAAAVKRQARHPDHGGRPDPRRAAGRGDPAGRRRRPDRDRPPGALRPVLGAACRAGAGLRHRLRHVDSRIRLVARQAQEQPLGRSKKTTGNAQ